MAETQTETGAPPAQEGGSFPPLDATTFVPQLFWLAVTFAFLYVMLARVALPRIAQVIEERRDRIADDLDTAEQHSKEADEALKAYEKVLADARARASDIAAETRAAIKAESDSRRAEVDAEIAREIEAAEARIGETKARAIAGVRAASVEVAVAIIYRLIHVHPPSADMERAVDEELTAAA